MVLQIGIQQISHRLNTDETQTITNGSWGLGAEMITDDATSIQARCFPLCLGVFV